MKTHARWSLLGVLALSVFARGGRAADPLADGALPLAARDRPFLLMDVPRRYLPGESAAVRVQFAGGGAVTLDVFRVQDPSALERDPISRNGVSIAGTPLGADAEALVAQTSALPRVGRALTLVREQRETLDVPAPVRRNVGNEAPAYESNETDEGSVETWGVHADGWADRRVSLGALPTGVYLVRAHVGAWATTSLLSVGEITLLARRGDHHDTVRVSDGEGRPVADVAVEARSGGAVDCTAQTDAHGEARCPPSDAPERRFVARRGDDRAWADVTHARMSACDPRVYLATGRPVFRPNEEIHLRGNVRGCASDRDAPLARQPVRLWNGDNTAAAQTVTTDESGNFTAILRAESTELTAEIGGVRHVRSIQIDARSLPTHALLVRLDRAWAAAGETVHVRVSDDRGEWPTEARVELTLPGGVRSLTVGPGRAGEASFVVPAVREALTTLPVRARLEASGGVVFASADLFVGRTPTVLELGTVATEGASGQTLPVTLRAHDLGGTGAAGVVSLAVYGADAGGTRRVGAARWSGRTNVDDRGEVRADVTLAGEGPWWIEATQGNATATMVEWERARPVTLSTRGSLAVQPVQRTQTPGEAMAVDVRVPEGAGTTWLTLEQGAVWSSVEVPSGAAGATVRVTIPVPPEARGMATLVATRVHGAEVTTASSATEVESARRVALTLRSDRAVYAKGATAHIDVTATTADGAPRDGVLTVWMADAGYWELGQEHYPSPNGYFALPGRRASAGDSVHPRGFGAEEGRRLDAWIEWNGARLDGSTFRHGWGHPSELVSFEKRGTLDAVAQELARRVGFARADVCAQRARELGTLSVRAQNLPWDLVAARIATQSHTEAFVRDHVLHLSCDSPPFGGLGSSGTGSGSGGGAGRGMRGIGGTRAQRLEGTLFFLPLRALGPSGHTVVDVPLPDHPGRWRVEALVIAQDGGGAEANAVMTTQQTLTGRIEVPVALGEGDAVRGSIGVSAPSLAGRAVPVQLTTQGAVALVGDAPTTVTLDARGEGSAAITLRANGAGDGAVRLRAGDGASTDDLSQTVHVREDAFTQPLAMRAFVGPGATDVDVPIPELSRSTEVTVAVDTSLRESVEAVLAGLRASRWNVASLRLDRLASLAALDRATQEAFDPELSSLRNEIHRELAFEIENLAALRGSDGSVGWWSRMPSSARLSAELLWALGYSTHDTRWQDAVEIVRRAAEQGPSREVPMYAAALALRGAPGRELATQLLRSPAGHATELEPLVWELRAALTVHAPDRVQETGRRLDRALAARLSARADVASCRGVAWFLCMTRYGDQALLAQAANVLLQANVDGAQARGAEVLAWYGRHPVSALWFDWGTEEADVLELMARLHGRTMETRFEVRVGDRVVGLGDATHPVRVSVRDAGVVRASFAAATGRALRVRADGALPLADVTGTTGPSGLTRALVSGADGVTLVGQFTVARTTERVELSLPLPAGMDLAVPVGDRAAVAVRSAAAGLSWSMMDATPDAPPVVDVRDGVAHVRFRVLNQGVHTVRLPLARVASGSFRVGAAWLRSADDREWSVTPPIRWEN